MRQSPTISEFRKQLKTHLFRIASPSKIFLYSCFVISPFERSFYEWKRRYTIQIHFYYNFYPVSQAGSTSNAAGSTDLTIGSASNSSGSRIGQREPPKSANLAAQPAPAPLTSHDSVAARVHAAHPAKTPVQALVKTTAQPSKTESAEATGARPKQQAAHHVHHCHSRPRQRGTGPTFVKKSFFAKKDKMKSCSI